MHFDLQGSRLFRALVLGSHLLVALLAVVTGIATTMNWPVSLLILCSCGFSYLLADNARRQKERGCKLLYQRGEFILLDEEMREIARGIQGEVFSSPWLIILQFALAEGGRSKGVSRVFFRDSLSADAWRRLRVSLRTLPD